MPRVLLLAQTTGYQTRAFGDAAERLGVDLVFATDRCHVLEDPWRDGAIPIRFFDQDGSVAAILEASASRGLDGVLAVGDRSTVIAARVLEALGLPGHPPAAAGTASNKELTRRQLAGAGLPAPWFIVTPIAADPSAIAPTLPFPCVVKPLALSGSRGVIRADDPEAFAAAFGRLRTLLQSPEVRAERNDAHDRALVEGFIPGREYALEGLMNHGTLQVLALFDKPEPLDGPFFEETIYVTPSSAPDAEQAAIREAVAAAAAAIGLRHGPVHAECRVSAPGAHGGRPGADPAPPHVVVLEVAARPIGGLCARALAFVAPLHDAPIPLEELLLRHALGEPGANWQRERDASGVMMIPIPQRGIFRRASGIDEARAVPGVTDVRITAKPDQLLVPLPEGSSYLGFIFARGPSADSVSRALRAAHACIRFDLDAEIPVVGTR
jgi:biotin carboxylase